MALQTFALLANALKTDYDSVIRGQVFSETVALSKLKTNVGVQPMANNSFTIGVRAAGHSGVYTDDGAAGADLNTGEPTYAQPTVPARFAWGTHQIADSVLSGARGSAEALVNIAEDFAGEVALSMRKDLNRQFYQRGGTEANNNIVATVNGASSGTTITVDDALSGTTNSTGPSLGTEFIYPGSLIDVGTDAEHGAGTDDQVTVSTVDSATAITLSASNTTADNDHIKFRNGDNTGLNGFRSFADTDNTFQGVTRSSSYWAQAPLDETAEALSEADMIRINIRTNKRGKVNAILTGHLLYEKYASLLTSQKRTKDPKDSLLGGFTGLEFASGGPGVVVLLDHHCPYGDVNFVSMDPKYITMAELDMGWMDRGEGVLKPTSLRGSYWATYRFFGNYAVRGFAAHGALQAKTT